jgi:hypothetical protein
MVKVSLIETGIYFIINGFTTAIIVTINDRLFRRHVDKAIDNAIAKAKKVTNDNGRNKNEKEIS